jgi:AraC-like DNA-binding protein
VSLSGAAVQSAFSDQAHMSREFRDLLGASPGRLSERLYAAQRLRFSAERNLRSTGLLLLQRENAVAP